MFGNGGFPARDPQYQRSAHGTEVASLALGGMPADDLTNRLRGLLRLSIANVVSREKRAGVPPNWRINPESVSDSLRYTESIQARLLSWSIQSGQPMTSVETALERYDSSLVVVAAGNDGTFVDDQGSYPTAYAREHGKRMITVAAHGPLPDAELTHWSNSGRKTIDLAAPGCGVETLSTDGVRRRVDGTSFAAPLVTFTAALLMAEGMTEPEGIKRRIMTTVDLDPALTDYVASGGRLDIPKAISIADDVIQQRSASGGGEPMRSGRILEPEEWPVCGRQVDRADLLRIVPHYDPGGERPSLVVTKKHLATSGRDAGVDYEHCALPPFSIRFEDREGGAPETIAVADLVDLVPAIR